MKPQDKKNKIKSLVIDMMVASHANMINNIEKVLNSDAVDIDKWDEKSNPMILPKCILTAILEQESTQYAGSGTSFQKEIKKEVKNIRYFI